MPVPITCTCGLNFKILDQFAGRQVQCACQQILTVPVPLKKIEPLRDFPAHREDPLSEISRGLLEPDEVSDRSGVSQWVVVSVATCAVLLLVVTIVVVLNHGKEDVPVAQDGLGDSSNDKRDAAPFNQGPDSQSRLWKEEQERRKKEAEATAREEEERRKKEAEATAREQAERRKREAEARAALEETEKRAASQFRDAEALLVDAKTRNNGIERMRQIVREFPGTESAMTAQRMLKEIEAEAQAREVEERRKREAEAERKAKLARDEVKAAPFLRYAKKLADTGMMEKAKERLREIIKDYPATEAAKEARQLLKLLESLSK